MKNRHSALCTLHSAFCIRRRSAGQALVEYAIVFPLQLLITLLIIQLAHLFVAKQMIEYSAFCAARAGLSQAQTQTATIDQDACKRAAIIPLSIIAGRSGVNEADYIWIPGVDPQGNPVGWGDRARNSEGFLAGSGAADIKTNVSVTPQALNGQPTIYAEVKHDYELNVPIANAVMYRLGDLAPSMYVDRATYDGAPHLKMTGTCTLAQPWGE